MVGFCRTFWKVYFYPSGLLIFVIWIVSTGKWILSGFVISNALCKTLCFGWRFLVIDMEFLFEGKNKRKKAWRRKQKRREEKRLRAEVSNPLVECSHSSSDDSKNFETFVLVFPSFEEKSESFETIPTIFWILLTCSMVFHWDRLEGNTRSTCIVVPMNPFDCVLLPSFSFCLIPFTGRSAGMWEGNDTERRREMQKRPKEWKIRTTNKDSDNSEVTHSFLRPEKQNQSTKTR